MKKTILATAAAAFLALSASAQSDVLNIRLSDGSIQKFKVDDIAEMTFSTEEDNPAAAYIGSFSGTNTVVVGGQFTYTADITYTITQGADGTLDISIPTYQLENTVMGNLTLGSYEVKGLAFDEAKNAYYRDYADDGLSMHFKAEGSMAMDNDYEFKPTSEISVELTEDGIKVVNSFKMGSMPFPIVATFNGTK